MQLKRASSFAIAAVFLTAQLVSFEHRLEVQHAVCAEHGEQVHTSGASAGADNSVSARPGAPDEAHDHCTAFFARREELAPACPAVLALPTGPAVERPAVAANAVVPQSPVAVLRLAPKGSPPVQG